MFSSYTGRRAAPHVLVSAAVEIGTAALCFHIALQAALLPDSEATAAPIVGVFALTALTAALAAGTYDTRRLSNRHSTWTRRLFMYGAALVVALAFDRIGINTGIALPAHGLAAVVAACGGLIAFTTASHIGRRGSKRKVLVLGTGRLAANLAKLEDGVPSWCCERFLQLPGEQRPPTDMHVHAVPPGVLADHAAASGAAEIIIAVEDRRKSLPMEQLVEAKKRGLLVTSYQEFIEREYGWIDTSTLTDNWFLRQGTIRNRKWRTDTKRILDILFSLLILTLTAPLCCLIAMAIKLDDGGDVLFRQSRVGLHGRNFVMLKFRSMRQSRDHQPMWSNSGDNRITRFGSFLRRSRLDELPQLANVLRGDMSLVGPRPEQPFFVEKLQREIPYYDKRLWLKPGLTGWAQVSFPYAATIDDARIKQGYDLYYLAHWGLLLDCQIMIKTIGTMIWPAHAQDVGLLATNQQADTQLGEITRHSRSA